MTIKNDHKHTHQQTHEQEVKKRSSVTLAVTVCYSRVGIEASNSISHSQGRGMNSTKIFFVFWKWMYFVSKIIKLGPFFYHSKVNKWIKLWINHSNFQTINSKCTTTYEQVKNRLYATLHWRRVRRNWNFLREIVQKFLKALEYSYTDRDIFDIWKELLLAIKYTKSWCKNVWYTKNVPPKPNRRHLIDRFWPKLVKSFLSYVCWNKALFMVEIQIRRNRNWTTTLLEVMRL